MLTTCQNCGKEFDAKRAAMKYCSKKCLYQNRVKAQQIRKCNRCGKEFQPKSLNHKYCCNEQHLLVEKIVKICEYCGKEFHTKNINHKYCCNEQHIPVEKIVKICKRCGKKFDSKIDKNDKIFCSIKCEKPVETKACLYCGKKFETTKLRKKFCNIVCTCKFHREKYARQRAIEFIKNKDRRKRYFIPRYPSELKVCVSCSKEFKSNSKTQKYCSVRCGYEFRLKQHVSNIKIKACSYCGKAFESRKHLQIFCSIECRNRSQHTVRYYVPKGEVKIKVCAYCGKEFETRNSLKRFCDSNCTYNFALEDRRKNKEYYKKYKKTF